MLFMAEIVHRLIQLLVLIIIIQVALTYFLDPYHKIRLALDRFVEPIYAPIRRLVPTMGMIDLSPLILIILLQVLDYILQRIFFAFAS